MRITKDVILLDASKGSHVYLIYGDENILIDSGWPSSTEAILEELQGLDFPPKRIGKILLTHHDVDHIGGAKRLQEVTGAELWAPEADISFITGEKKRPGVKRVVTLIAKPQTPAGVNAFTDGQQFATVRAISAIGHTPGHTIFQYHDVIFIGDLFKYINGRFRLSSHLMNWDKAKALESIAVLKSLDFEWLCPAHGDPVRNSKYLQDFLNRSE